MLRFEKFDQILQKLKECGSFILIGGQAVNFWAERYEGQDHELKKLMPYTSLDCDIYVSNETWQHVKTAYKDAGLVAAYSPLDVQLGILTLGEALKVDILDHVFGLHPNLAKKLEPSAKQFGYLRVCAPALLFVGKCHNYSTLPQGGRQDAKHLLMLSRIIPCYLTEAVEAVEQAGAGSERYAKALKKEVKQLLSFDNDRCVRGACDQLAFSLIDLIPVERLCDSTSTVLSIYAQRSLR